MVWDPKQETVDVNRMIIYSFVPILSVYALWRIQKFWLISLISIPISFGMQLLMTAATIPSQNQPIVGILLFLMTLGSYIAICVLLVRHYAQKYNKKIENIGGAIEPKPAVISSTVNSHVENSEKICSDCYHEEKQHGKFFDKYDEPVCSGCKDDGFAMCCENFSEISENNKQSIPNNEIIDVVKSKDLEQLDKKLTEEKMDEEQVAEYLELIEELQKEGLGNSNSLIEIKQLLVKDMGLDENNIQYLTELDIQLDKQVNEITASIEKSEKDREERQKELDDLKKMEAEEKLEESKRQVEEAEKELEEKKKRKEESRNKMEGEEKLEESKRQVEEAEKELEEKKKRKEESRNNGEIDKQITINEEKIRKIEEESKKLDEGD